MASEWRTFTLGEICEFRAGSVFKPALQGKASGDFPFVKVSDMNLPANAVRIQVANNWVSCEDVTELKARPLPPGTVIFAKIGEALRQNRLRQLTRDTLIDNNMMGAIPSEDKVDPHYFYYALSQFDFADIAQGTALPYLTVAALSTLTLDVPPISEQRAIAHILGTLDDKIELNRRQNETLEAMARALFKAWFVDFEPVRAKMEGRWQRGQSLPGLPAHLYDLFPDRLVESELGETNSPRANLDDGIGGPQGGGRESRRIPEGWEWAPASRLIEFNPREALRKGTVAPYLEMSALPTSGSWPEPPVLRPFGSGMRFRNGDTLLARITPCLENGKTAFVQCLPDNAVGWGSTEFIVMRPRHPVPKEFGYLLARDDAFRAHAIRSMTGTSGRQRVQADSVANFPIAMPSNEDLWQEFARLVSPAFKSIKANAEAVETLAQLRDTLLPKLISGDLRVKDAERFMTRMEA